jgi:hypothetical protein
MYAEYEQRQRESVDGYLSDRIFERFTKRDLGQ